MGMNFEIAGLVTSWIHVALTVYPAFNGIDKYSYMIKYRLVRNHRGWAQRLNFLGGGGPHNLN